jgi:hypothetical protein
LRLSKPHHELCGDDGELSKPCFPRSLSVKRFAFRKPCRTLLKGSVADLICSVQKTRAMGETL